MIHSRLFVSDSLEVVFTDSKRVALKKMNLVSRKKLEPVKFEGVTVLDAVHASEEVKQSGENNAL